MSFSVALPEKKYATEQQQINFYKPLAERLASLPGVQHVRLASGLPLGNNGWQTSFMVEGKPVPQPQDMPLMEACLASPDYFRAMSIPLLKGRYFTDQDNRDHLKGKDLSKLNEVQQFVAGINAIIVDQEFERRYWPGEEAVGKRIRMGTEPDAPAATVIGVVGRVKMEALSTDSNRVQGYFSFAQIPGRGMTVIVKSTTDPAQMVAAARREVLALDSSQPIFAVRTMDEIRSESVAPEKLNLTLLVLFSGIALILALVGDLRRDVIFRHTTNARNRNTDGTRRTGKRCVEDGNRAGNEADFDWCRHRFNRRIRSDEIDARVVVRCEADRPVDVRCYCFAVGGSCFFSLLAARTQSNES